MKLVTLCYSFRSNFDACFSDPNNQSIIGNVIDTVHTMNVEIGCRREIKLIIYIAVIVNKLYIYTLIFVFSSSIV